MSLLLDRSSNATMADTRQPGTHLPRSMHSHRIDAELLRPRNPSHSCVDECNHRARVHIGRVFYLMNGSAATYRIAQPASGKDAVRRRALL